MARLLVLYKQPRDPAAFDRYYAETHIPLARQIPGLRTYLVSSGGVALVAGGETAYLVAELEFDSMADLQSAMGSPEGQAAAADVASFADGGVSILAFDTKSV